MQTGGLPLTVAVIPGPGGFASRAVGAAVPAAALVFILPAYVINGTRISGFGLVAWPAAAMRSWHSMRTPRATPDP